jgi:sigma-E factor negative regulatory protein RseA
VEKISALMDGEIGGAEAAVQVKRLKDDTRLRAAWDAYHVIGDTMRGEKLWLSQRFTEGFSEVLAKEPTVLAPHTRNPLLVTVRRFALPVAASVGGMMLVAWLALFNNPFAPKENVAVMTPTPTEAQARAASAEVNDYLMAHQQFSSGATLPGVASYVRTVSGDTEEKR